jgi:hypothetical protein
MPQNQTQYLVTLRNAAGGDLGIYSSFNGGKVTSGTVMDRAPGQKYPTASGGDKTIEAVTIGRRGRRERDNDLYRAKLRGLVGVENGVICNVRTLDADGNPYEKGDTYIATVTGYTPSPADNNSESEPAVFEVELQPSDVN